MLRVTRTIGLIGVQESDSEYAQHFATHTRAQILSRSLAVGGTHHLVVALLSSYMYHLFPFIRA
jgi:hypothetical protein